MHDELPIGGILMSLLGGLALFLYGMDQMADALKLIAGERMKTILARLTTNRFTGAIAGALVTAVIQSSSVTTVLIVGFISAGIMTLPQSIGVIMGANVGTTITAQIVALKVTQYALLLVAVGFALLFLSRGEKLRHYGHVIMGLGLIFFGMQLMGDGTKPLRTYEPFIRMMREIDRPMMAVMVGGVFTALVQSSSATTGIVIALASNGYISLETGILLVLGSNVGTCVTALLAAVGKPRDAVRAAVIHVLFNVAGVLIWIGLTGHLAEFVRQISPAASPQVISEAAEGLRRDLPHVNSLSAEQFAQAARRSAETPRQIANAHTIFNLGNTALLIWFAGPLAWLVKRILPDRVQPPPPTDRPRYLDDLLLQTPALAMDTVRRELGRLGTIALRMVRRSLRVVLEGSQDELTQLARMDREVDRLHGAIVAYLGRLSREDLNDQQSVQLHDDLAAANYIESIADVVETNLVESGQVRLKDHLVISSSTRAVLTDFHQAVLTNVEKAIRGLVERDLDAAHEVVAAKAEVTRLADAAEEHLSRRLVADEPNRVAAFRLESDIIEYLKRVYYFSKRIAKSVVEHAPPRSSRPETDEGPS